MDIRTKLALALVSVSLLGMLSLGTFAYQVASNLLQEISARQLDALAESKKQDLEQVIASWRNHVRLIRSRTQLRIQLKEYQDTQRQESLQEMRRIAADAQESTENVRRITLFDVAGKQVVSAGQATRSPLAGHNGAADEVTYSGFYLGVDGRPKVVFNSLMQLDGEKIGSIEVVIDVANLENLAGNYRGLGESGETLVVGHEQTGALVLLHGLRHSDVAPTWRVLPDYVQSAIAGDTKIFTQDVEDYRGNDVWAATRYLPDVNWGLVVKVDAEEETQRARTLRDNLIDLGLALGAFAVAGGTLLGFYLARPIRELADVVRRVRHGESALRADASSDDEIGFLAAALNDYLDQVGGSRNTTDSDDRDA